MTTVSDVPAEGDDGVTRPGTGTSSGVGPVGADVLLSGGVVPVATPAAAVVAAIAVTAEARVVYVASSDGALTHWQWRRGAARESAPRNGGELRGHKTAVLSLAVAGRVVVSGSADRTICVWRRDEGADHSRLAVLTGHKGPVKCLAMDEEETLDADGALLARDDPDLVDRGRRERVDVRQARLERDP